MGGAPLTTTATGEPAARGGPWRVLRSGTFRKLWVALVLSLFGDFFNYVATAWLVLQMTGSSLTLGVVLMAQAIPRALLMLVGGALTDRLSARLTMAASTALRVACVGPLAVLVLSGHVQLWEVFVFSALFGVFDAFFLPAQSAILPRIVADADLEPGNAVMNVSRQAAVVGGPALAGLVVAAMGTGWAFAADAVCFAIAAVLIQWLPAMPAAAAPEAAAGLGGEIMAGVRYAWSDVGIRATLVIVAVVDFAATGALTVGLPSLAHDRFAAGAAGLGVLFGAWGAGATVGAAAAGMVRRPERMGRLIVGVCAWIGLGIGLTGLAPTLLPAALVLGIAGIATGVINTYGVSWLQRRTDPGMQGRVQSLVMLASLGLAPVALAGSGAIAEVAPTLLFAAAGALILAAAAGAASSRTVRAL